MSKLGVLQDRQFKAYCKLIDSLDKKQYKLLVAYDLVNDGWLKELWGGK